MAQQPHGAAIRAQRDVAEHLRKPRRFIGDHEVACHGVAPTYTHAHALHGRDRRLFQPHDSFRNPVQPAHAHHGSRNAAGAHFGDVHTGTKIRAGARENHRVDCVILANLLESFPQADAHCHGDGVLLVRTIQRHDPEAALDSVFDRHPAPISASWPACGAAPHAASTPW